MSEFRHATVADLATIVALAHTCHLPDWTEAGWAAELDKSHAIFWVNETVSALGLLWVLDDDAELVSICVQPALRRSALATRLFTELRTQAQSRGARRIWLEVRSDNTPALALYYKLGFAKNRARRNYYKDGCDAIEMVMQTHDAAHKMD